MMRVILNTRPLIFTKTGIGHYIANILEGLSHREEVRIFPTVDAVSTKRLGALSRVSAVSRRLVGDALLRVSRPVGDFLISRATRKHTLPGAEIYHETNYDPIPRGPWKGVANIYDLSFLRYPEYLPEEVVRKCRTNLSNILSASRFIVNTSAVKDEVRDTLKIGDERIDVVPLAPSAHCCRARGMSDVSEETEDLFEGEDYVLYVGTVEPRKNLPALFRAFRLLATRYRLKLVVAGGKGWLCEDILRMPRELGIAGLVIFTGYVDRRTLLRLYARATIFVYPSLYEGFGLPVLEAMSHGLPVITSDTPSLREVTGNAAVHVDPLNHEQLAYEMERLVASQSLQGEFRQKSLARAGDFSWDRVVSLTLRTYRAALEQ